MVKIESASELEDWKNYREFVRERFKMLSGEEEPLFISKLKFSFDQDGKTWNSYAILAGKKGVLAMQKLRKEGILFREGTCAVQGKQLVAHGLPSQLVKGAQKTLLKLKLGYSIEGGEEAPDEGGASSVEDAQAGWERARKKAVDTTIKLGKAIAATKEPEAAQALILLKAIQANLTRIPDTMQKVQELERYLRTDDILDEVEDPNPFSIEVKLREPLLEALEPLRNALSV